MKYIAIIVMLCFASVLSGCRRADVRDFTLDIPALTQENAQLIGTALMQFSAVERDSLKFDFADKKLSLRYDSLGVAKKNLEMAVAAVGFTANGITPESVGAKSK